MSDEEQKKLNANAKEQQNLAAKTDKALAQIQKTAETMTKTDPASSEAMKQAVLTGQQQQVSSNQSKAAQSAKQNQQSQAQAAQKQAEIGLEMILNNLKEAERRKLEELAKSWRNCKPKSLGLSVVSPVTTSITSACKAPIESPNSKPPCAKISSRNPNAPKIR
jgi:restriction endonuclease S subunit